MPPPPPPPSQAGLDSGTLAALSARAVKAGVFGPIAVEKGVLKCQALHAGDEAEYRVSEEGGRVWVSLVTPGRYLSQSIEQDLLHRGDKAGDLLRDELIDLGGMASRDEPLPVVEHFRSPDRLYTFRTPVAGGTTAEKLGTLLLAYEACFRELGDMNAGDGDE